MRRSSRRNPKAAKSAAAATAPRRMRWRWRQRNSLNRAASRNDRVLRRIRSPGVACDLASSGAGVTPCLCAAHGSGESCFSVASLSPSFPLCLPLSPSISPKPMIATTSNRDCDEGRARLSRRRERRRAAREEGSKSRAAAKGEGEGGRGGERYCPSLSATNGLLCRPRPSHYFVAAEATQKYVVRARAKARDKRTN